MTEPSTGQVASGAAVGGQRAPAWWHTAGGSLLDLVYPPRCAFCGADLARRADALLLCAPCRSDLGGDESPRCGRCAARLPAGQTECPRCRSQRFAFHEVITLGSYESQLRDAVLRAKRVGQESLVFALVDLLVQRRQTWLDAHVFDGIVSIPMHWQRRLFRGTSSPDLIAERLARSMPGVRVHRALRRRRNTLPQGGLRPARRRRNVRGAFATNRRHDLSAKHLLLVDDVMTTGATCHEAARVLRGAGAGHVTVVALARTEHGN